MAHEQPTTKTRTGTSPGTAMITGASSGMGAVYADRLARRGHDLILVARSAERLSALANAISADTGRHVDYLAADLQQSDEVDRIEDRLRGDTRISMLVNNAGIGSSMPLIHSDVATMRAMVTLNVEVLMRLTYAAVPRFVRQGRGTIINMASIVAIAPEILNGVYGGTKAFVVGFTQSLHHELADKGIRVQAVLPGAVGTPFWDKAGTPLSAVPKDIVMSAEDAVDAALVGLDQDELITLPALPDISAWQAYEEARQRMMPNLSRTAPAARYRMDRSQAAASG
ncbi:SDR family oxidoreductase [Frateuria edaphi]|uniref:SDR family NAD(P)-dependent oxidoreductase n=1 Tax=Frateuria edaphi TaxID=2898793 RepID=UPI001E37CFC7|nr:SDR family oxidoreductase [Frateuria edaphi]UGB45449.1 SDR family oxidoreductase [Frateuria edaphi]